MRDLRSSGDNMHGSLWAEVAVTRWGKAICELFRGRHILQGMSESVTRFWILDV